MNSGEYELNYEGAIG